MRRALTWLLALPLIVAGSQVAHGLAYWWAYPIANARLAILEHSGHGYQAYAPILLGFLAAIELLVLAVSVADRVRGHPARRLPPWVFLWLPAVGFVLQEHLERFFSAGVFPWWAVEEPTFWRGLVLQIPLGLIAWAVARLLGRTVEFVATAIVEHRHRSVPVRLRLAQLWWCASVVLPRQLPLAFGAAGRAPPSSFALSSCPQRAA